MQQVEPHSGVPRARYQEVGLVGGPFVFVLMLLAESSQTGMSIEAWRTAAVGLWMAIWWATEAIPVPATAFLPIISFPVLGIADLKQATASYANPILYLFLGAFILALAVERWQLHKRVALLILSFTGTDGKRLIGGFMLVSAMLSMWMTNTSTTMMLMPIALSVANVVADQVDGLSAKRKNDFQTATLLGLAFAATIGGLATLVGTPPNALLAAFLTENYGIEITFASWMLVGVPVTMFMLPIAWYTLTHVSFNVDIPSNPDVQQHIDELRKELGSMTSAERRVAIVFGLVVLFWIIRRPLSSWLNIDFLSDSGIVMMGALLLFLLPSGSKKQAKLMTWQDTRDLPWGVLILFGGGLSLASAVAGTGLAKFLGESLLPLSGFGLFALIVAATGLVIFLTELTSNLATTATFLPVVAAIALQLDVTPLMLCVPITLAASCAFMLPVATPPNAIVFASGKIAIPQMIKAGVILNFIGMILLTFVSVWWAPHILL